LAHGVFHMNRDPTSAATPALHLLREADYCVEKHVGSGFEVFR
jgi:hypothetical protein